MEAVDPTVFRLAIFVLAIFVGYYVVWSVTPALHTPLMAVTNAISSVIIVGALLAAAAHGVTGSRRLGLQGRRRGGGGLASVNIFGGFLVTQRMLAMYRRRTNRSEGLTEEPHVRADARATPPKRGQIRASPHCGSRRSRQGRADHEHQRRHPSLPRLRRPVHPGAAGALQPGDQPAREHHGHGRHGDRRRHQPGAARREAAARRDDAGPDRRRRRRRRRRSAR